VPNPSHRMDKPDSRLVFYADSETFDRFEESLDMRQRFMSKRHPLPNLAVPLNRGPWTEWPILVKRA
jgi:hypothetical protein